MAAGGRVDHHGAAVPRLGGVSTFPSTLRDTAPGCRSPGEGSCQIGSSVSDTIFASRRTRTSWASLPPYFEAGVAHQHSLRFFFLNKKLISYGRRMASKLRIILLRHARSTDALSFYTKKKKKPKKTKAAAVRTKSPLRSPPQLESRRPRRPPLPG